MMALAAEVDERWGGRASSADGQVRVLRVGYVLFLTGQVRVIYTMLSLRLAGAIRRNQNPTHYVLASRGVTLAKRIDSRVRFRYRYKGKLLVHLGACILNDGQVWQRRG